MKIEIIRKKLKELSEPEYAKFNKKLCPDTKKQVLGIRIPKLRTLAKEILKDEEWKEFIEKADINCFEETILKGLVIAYSKVDLKEKLILVKEFIPNMDSWAITDTFCPTLKIKSEDLEKVWSFILPYTKSDKEFEARFSIIMMLDYYITEEYIDKVIKVIDEIENNAEIIECTEKIKSKGEALKYSFKFLNDNFNCYDAFIIFDADNVVHPQFIEKMNDALCSGYQLAQGYRDSKNPHDTWISNCYTLYYMIQNHFFNRARMNIGQSSFINGTGFMIAKERLYKKGYNPKSMTEDIELSVKCAINNEEIAFVREAITYDEQITTLKESFKQRMRWSIGTNQCLINYAPNLIQGGIKGKLNCIDALIFLMAPTLQIVSSVAFALHIILAIIYGISHDTFSSLLCCYLTSIALSIFAIKSNNKRIKAYLKGILTFPIFILTWIPVNIIALWKRNYKWGRIEHNKSITIEKVLDYDNQEEKIKTA